MIILRRLSILISATFPLGIKIPSNGPIATIIRTTKNPVRIQLTQQYSTFPISWERSTVQIRRLANFANCNHSQLPFNFLCVKYRSEFICNVLYMTCYLQFWSNGISLCLIVEMMRFLFNLKHNMFTKSVKNHAYSLVKRLSKKPP